MATHAPTQCRQSFLASHWLILSSLPSDWPLLTPTLSILGLVWECRLREAPNSWFEIFDSFEIFQTQKTVFRISHKLPLTCTVSCSIFTREVYNFFILLLFEPKTLY